MKRNPNLDIIRALLASWVVVFHALRFAGFYGGWQAASGRLTVDAFIVLSGYVISKSLIIKRPGYWAFIQQRFWRLFPGFAVCLGFALLVRPLTLHTSSGEFVREAAENHFFWAQLIAHLTLLFGMVPNAILPDASGAFLPPAWSISLETQLYLLAPFLLYAIYRFRWRAVGIVTAFSSLAFFPPIAWRLQDYISPLGAFFPQKLFFFLVGMGLCIASRRAFWELQTQDIPLLPVPGAAALARLGAWSYSLYLVHYPVLHLVKAALPAGFPVWATALLLITIGGSISVAFSALLYRYVELTGMAFGRRLTKGR
jgi:peptidoglycan/LPS O-acetylase OafA/YrhL